MLWMIAIFCGAVVADILHALYTRSVAEGRRMRSAAISAACTLLSVSIWSWVISHVDSHGVVGALVLAGGSSVGTLIGLRKV